MDSLIAQRDFAKLRVSEEKEALVKAEEQEAVALSAQEHIQHLAQQTQQQAHKQIARVVSRCLSAVFENPYSLKIEFERKRGKTEAEFAYYRNGNRVDPHVASGGVMDVASLALRLAALILSMPPARRLLVLDEPWRDLSPENRQKMAELLVHLSEELDLQTIVVSHDSELQIGKVIRI